MVKMCEVSLSCSTFVDDSSVGGSQYFIFIHSIFFFVLFHKLYILFYLSGFLKCDVFAFH